jgi:D-glycero-D-manno-heptose 1,7-bisphosphate phosphatase
MNQQLQKNLPIDSIKVCYHSQSEGCTCRKPKPGILTEAADQFQIDLHKSYMIGDRWSDIVAGKAAGCLTILIYRGYQEPITEQPDIQVSSLLEAAQVILDRESVKNSSESVNLC